MRLAPAPVPRFLPSTWCSKTIPGFELPQQTVANGGFCLQGKVVVSTFLSTLEENEDVRCVAFETGEEVGRIAEACVFQDNIVALISPCLLTSPIAPMLRQLPPLTDSLLVLHGLVRCPESVDKALLHGTVHRKRFRRS